MANNHVWCTHTNMTRVDRSLACLAEEHERIKSIFLTQDVNEEGRYVLSFFKTGQLLHVAVDDYIPCKGPTEQPVFSRTKRDELWPMLLEKAWAKVHGCVFNIRAMQTNKDE